NFVVLVYLVGLIYAIQALFNKPTLTRRSTFIFLLSIMGIGLFTYFQSRSHNWSLIAISGNAIILLAIFADILLEKVKARAPLSSLLPFHLAVVVIVAVLGFSGIDLFRHQSRWKSLYEQKADKKANLSEQQVVEGNIAFIKSNLPKTTEKIYIHTSNKFQSLYFDFTKKRSAFNPSIIDIFTIENCTRLQNRILLDSSDVFIEPTKFYYPYVQGVNAAMCATYSVDTANEQMSYMKKRTYRTLEQPVLDSSQSPQALVYEKFSDDTSSLNRRIHCAIKGKEPLAWDDQLSIELVFFAGKQAYQAGTLFSNYNDSSGVWFLNNGAPEQYLFQWGKSWGVPLQLKPDRWHYLALQANKSMLSIFVDGNLLNHYIIPAPIASTDSRFYIASDGRRNLHFTGAISEISIKKGLLSAQDVQARQKKIQAQL
ncbi:MAG: LamG domain-containing protein, partial [Prevotellaceae bacterium]|nr:LamG domain-containing protein [Prevotellaceae bacterium]